jgi:shikimate kinase
MNQQFTKITLLGYMGSGKSTVARILGSEMGVPALDLDDYIIEKEGLSIPEIFASRGEIYFRRMENKYLTELLDSEESFVLSLGGGTPCYADNMEQIVQKSRSIYLRASIGTLFDRLVQEKENRPLISSLEEEQLAEFIAKHLFERRSFYERAGETIVIDGKDPQLIAREIGHSR